jgi:flagellar hook assembly protein FlgD
LALRLESASPNPFSKATEFRFTLPTPGQVSLTVFDVRGRVVRRVLGAELPGGYHRVSWDGRDGKGREIEAGVYLCKLEAGGVSRTMRIARLH